jgi:hypothetical protein
MTITIIGNSHAKQSTIINRIVADEMCPLDTDILALCVQV